MNYKVIALIVMGIVFVFDTLMHYLDSKSAERKIPANVADIYDEEEYKRWLAYDKECNKLALFRHLISSLVAFLLDWKFKNGFKNIPCENYKNILKTKIKLKMQPYGSTYLRMTEMPLIKEVK